MPPTARPLSVICLCAEWCGTCREYRVGFERVMAGFPEAQSFWLDIEDHADDLGDLDIENFPTLLIHRGQSILYYGVMLPYPERLARILENFQVQDGDGGDSSPEHRGWQEDPDLQHLLAVWLPRQTQG